MIGLFVFCKDRWSFCKKLEGCITSNKHFIVICHNSTQETWVKKKIEEYHKDLKYIVCQNVTTCYEDNTFDIAFLMADSRSGSPKDLLANINRLGKLKLNMVICNANIHVEKQLPITPEDVVKVLSDMVKHANGKSVCGIKVKNVPGVKGGKTIDTSDPSTIQKITQIVTENKSKLFFDSELVSEIKKISSKQIELFKND